MLMGHHNGYNIGLKQHDIFIHEKGQFWLNDKMETETQKDHKNIFPDCAV